jgi:3-hydroxyacyl-CoA dehydrogenase
MFYADTIGLQTVLDRVHRYRNQLGAYWLPAPLLERLAASGQDFYSRNA